MWDYMGLTNNGLQLINNTSQKKSPYTLQRIHKKQCKHLY